jgi:hypothetical protein
MCTVGSRFFFMGVTQQRPGSSVRRHAIDHIDAPDHGILTS